MLRNFSAYSFPRSAALLASSVLGLTMVVPPVFAAATPADPAGYWITKDDESIMRISPCTAKPTAFCGTIVWLKEPLKDGKPQTDENNPDKTKQTRPLIGIEVLSDLEADEDHWKGKAYNADDGKIYDITFKAKGEKGEITGCVLRYLCKSETFKKTQTVPGGDPTLPPTAAAAPTAPATPHTGTATSKPAATPATPAHAH